MPVKKMAFEGQTFYGVAGATASAKLVNIRDESITTEPEKAETTVRGEGTSPPVVTERVTAISWSFEFTMVEKSDDNALEALKTAASNGTPVALRLKDHAAGKGYDGDVILSKRTGRPHKGDQTHTFTATPNDDNRAPQLYV